MTAAGIWILSHTKYIFNKRRISDFCHGISKSCEGVFSQQEVDTEQRPEDKAVGGEIETQAQTLDGTTVLGWSGTLGQSNCTFLEGPLRA